MHTVEACRRCGKQFEVHEYRAETALYCSFECTRDRVVVQCLACGVPLVVKRSRAARTRYCSKSCKHASQRDDSECSVSGCKVRQNSHGLCRAHYKRSLAGLELAKPFDGRPGEAVARFWWNVDRSAGPESCWLWMGALNCKGYGTTSTRRGARAGGITHQLAHRQAFALTSGSPGHLHVLHRCDNPRCCNPRHLFLGTHQENMADMVSKGRNARGKNVVNKLTEGDVREIRQRELSQSAMAEKYGVTPGTIASVLRGKSWGWVH